jgi:hypothetical protein
MSTQLLFYDSAVPVSIARHADCSVEVKDYGFCREVNSVPLMAVEFPMAAPEYPIVFATGEGAVTPVVVLGMRGKENLYVSREGTWEARYVPAFVRRYPFVFSAQDDGKRFVLCVDESFPGFNREGRGQRLFTDEKKASPYVDSVLKFLQEYRTQFLRTQSFCRKLKELDLLEPMRAQMSLGAGGQVSLTGFSAVERKKLKALPAEKLAELAKTDELELLYLHLQSMRNFTGVKDRMVLIQGGKTDPAATQEHEPAQEQDVGRAGPKTRARRATAAD